MFWKIKHVWFFWVYLLLSHSLILSGQTVISEIDFHPERGWQTKGAVKIRDDGRISLTENGRGMVWKWVELDLDKSPILLARISDSMPREWWQIIVAKDESSITDDSRRICLIKKYIEEGGFIIPIKKITGWKGKMKFVMGIEIEGHRWDWMEFSTLKAVSMRPDKPAAPKLSAPVNGMTVSPFALHYCWDQVKNAIKYELQVSRKPNFSENRSFTVKPFYLADKLPYLPGEEELLQGGKWFWRVRGFSIGGQAGNWSETGTFTVRKSMLNPRPSELRISNTHPFFILFSSGPGLTANWRAVPRKLKPYTILRIEEIQSGKLQTIMETAQENHIPIIIQASGPHDYYGQISSRIPLSEIERIFMDYPTVKGVYICEQAFRVSPEKNWIMMNYAKRLISLSAEYGKTVFWADGHWGRNLWIDVGLNKELFTTFRKYRQYIVPIWKMNDALTPYSAHDAIFGFWVSQAVDNWGVQPERWYWYEAGFGKLNHQAWFKEGVLADFPATFYGQMILLGLSSGATVYFLEPPSDIWQKDGDLSEISRAVTFPLFLDMISHHLIPNRKQVIPKIHNIYIADSLDARWSLDYGTMHNLYKNTYGIDHPFQMIPSFGKYFWLPILSKWTDHAILKQFPNCLDAAKVSGKESILKYLGKQDTVASNSDALVFFLNNCTIVMNSSENWNVDQTFEVSMEGKVKKIAGNVDVNSYLLVVQKNDDGLRILLNGREGKRQILKIWASEAPGQIIATPPKVLVSSSWNTADGCQILEFLLAQEAVTVEIKYSNKNVR